MDGEICRGLDRVIAAPATPDVPAAAIDELLLTMEEYGVIRSPPWVLDFAVTLMTHPRNATAENAVRLYNAVVGTNRPNFPYEPNVAQLIPLGQVLTTAVEGPSFGRFD